MRNGGTLLARGARALRLGDDGDGRVRVDAAKLMRVASRALMVTACAPMRLDARLVFARARARLASLDVELRAACCSGVRPSCVGRSWSVICSARMPRSRASSKRVR